MPSEPGIQPLCHRLHGDDLGPQPSCLNFPGQMAGPGGGGLGVTLQISQQVGFIERQQSRGQVGHGVAMIVGGVERGLRQDGLRVGPLQDQSATVGLQAHQMHPARLHDIDRAHLVAEVK